MAKKEVKNGLYAQKLDNGSWSWQYYEMGRSIYGCGGFESEESAMEAGKRFTDLPVMRAPEEDE